MHIQPPGLSRSDTQSRPDDLLTVAHARALVAGWADLSPTRLRALISALNCALEYQRHLLADRPLAGHRPGGLDVGMHARRPVR